MAVTATIPYGGLMVAGVEFRVTSAYIKEFPGEAATLVYQVRVLLPDGTPMTGVGWDNLNAVADPVEPSPLAQAEAAMIARLQASGATNIVEA